MAPPWEELSRESATVVGRHFELIPTPLPPLLGEGEQKAPPWEELSRVSVTEVGRHFEFVPTPLPPSSGGGN